MPGEKVAKEPKAGPAAKAVASAIAAGDSWCGNMLRVEWFFSRN